MLVHNRIKLVLLVLSLILFKFDSFSQIKSESESVVEPINPVWQNLQTDSQLNKLNNQIKEFRTNHKPYIFNKNIFNGIDLTVQIDKPTDFEMRNWTKISGPEGGDVRAFYKYYDSLYAVTDREIYIFRNDNWVPMKFEGILCNSITCLYVDTIGTILAGTDFYLVSSTDKGEYWSIHGGEISLTAIGDIIKLDKDSVLLATRKGIFIGRSDQFNYTLLNDDIKDVLTLTFENKNKIWAGTWNGVYKASFPEMNWERVNLDSTYYPKVLINKNGTIYTYSSEIVCKSTDHGNSWQYITGQYFSDITLDGDSDLVITGGGFIFRANENGVYWNSTQAATSILTAFKNTENEFYLGTLGTGAFKYNINENLFYDFNSGLQSATFRAIEILKNGSIFTITDANSYYLSTNSGVSWESKRQGWSRCTKQDKQGNLYVASNSGLIRSTDYGETWTTLDVHVVGYFINAIDISEDGNTICVGYSTGEVYISKDRGQSFQKILHGNYSFVESVIILKNKTILFQRDSLYYTTDNGLTLKTINEDHYFSRAFIEDQNGYIYMASVPGIYRSRDLLHWTLLTSNQYGLPMTFKLDSLGNIYAIFNGGIVTKTRNKGETWTLVTEPIPNTFMWSFDLDSEGNMYYGTQSKGIFYNKISIELEEEVIFNYKLKNNYPNPFNIVTRIEFEVPFESEMNLTIYDGLGRKIETLLEGTKAQGIYSVDWNASKYASGIYFAVIRATNHTLITKMVLLK